MILLPSGNKIVEETVFDKFQAKKEERSGIDVRLCDFDEVSYRIFVDPKEVNTLYFSMSAPAIAKLFQIGGAESYEKSFKDFIVEPKDGMDCTLKFELDSLPSDAAELANRVSRAKSIVFGGAFYKYLAGLKEGKPLSDSVEFNIRNDTKVFIIPSSDRVTVVFDLDFSNKADEQVAKVFLQEFVETRKHMRQAGNAPPLNYNIGVPMELKQFNIQKPNKVGYLSFVVLKGNLKNIEQAAHNLQNFRNYVKYHVKCSKAHFHQRMRARVAKLLQVLNRAKTGEKEKKKVKKTFGGKTFTRK